MHVFKSIPPGPSRPGCRSGRHGSGDTGAVPYDPTIYLGSAAHYRYGRPAYSPQLEAVLAREAGLDGTAGSWMPAAAPAC